MRSAWVSLLLWLGIPLLVLAALVLLLYGLVSR